MELEVEGRVAASGAPSAARVGARALSRSDERVFSLIEQRHRITVSAI